LWCRRLACTIPLPLNLCGWGVCVKKGKEARKGGIYAARPPGRRDACPTRVIASCCLRQGVLRLGPSGLAQDDGHGFAPQASSLKPPVFSWAGAARPRKNRAWRPGEIRDKKLVVGSRSFQRLLKQRRRRTSRRRMTRRRCADGTLKPYRVHSGKSSPSGCRYSSI